MSILLGLLKKVFLLFCVIFEDSGPDVLFVFTFFLNC